MNTYPPVVRQHHDMEDFWRQYDRECDYVVSTSQRTECHRAKGTIPEVDPNGPPKRLRVVVKRDFSSINDCDTIRNDEERRHQCHAFKGTVPGPLQPVKPRFDFTGVRDCDRIIDKDYQRLCKLDPKRKLSPESKVKQPAPIIEKRFDFSGFKGDCRTIADKAYVERCLAQQRDTTDAEVAIDYTKMDCKNIKNEPYQTQCLESKKKKRSRR